MSLPKQVVKQIGKLAQQTVETVVKEPVKIAESAVRQVGLDSSTERNKETERPTKEELEKKEAERQFKLKYIRQHLQELSQPRPEKPTVSEEERPKIAQEAQLKKQKQAPSEQVLAPKTGRPKRGSVFLGMQRKKTSEFGGSAATRSK